MATKTVSIRGGESAPKAPRAVSPPAASVFESQVGISTLSIALVGSFLMAAALPPLDWWPLGWIAPVPWLLLIRQPALDGWRPYRRLWLAGFVFWMAALHWLRLPHPVLALGWIALAAYLAFYIPVFVGLSRVAVHCLRIPLIVAAPLVWFGLELAKGHILGGFTMGSLGHTQYRWLSVIQIADMLGGYGVSALVMFVASGVASALPWGGERARLWFISPPLALMAIVIAYGELRLVEPALTNNSEIQPQIAHIALIQGSIDVDMKNDPEKAQRVFDEYFGLSQQAVAQAARDHRQLDLIVWPETMYRWPLVKFSDDFQLPADSKYTKEQIVTNQFARLADLRQQLGAPLLLGIDRAQVARDSEQHYNSSILIDNSGRVTGHYDKVHLVMFGEYIPLADWFPWLYRLTPLTQGAMRGEGPVAFSVGQENKYRIAPDICYETVIPHLIRGQVETLRAQGQEPDVLVNLTNDGWFWGSSELDMHLACGVFRAVECRKPLVIAANTGFSAWIESSGKIVKQGPRREKGYIIAEPQLDNRRSIYMAIGDWPAGICLFGCAILAVIGWRQRRRALPAA